MRFWLRAQWGLQDSCAQAEAHVHLGTGATLPSVCARHGCRLDMVPARRGHLCVCLQHTWALQ